MSKLRLTDRLKSLIEANTPPAVIISRREMLAQARKMKAEVGGYNSGTTDYITIFMLGKGDFQIEKRDEYTFSFLPSSMKKKNKKKEIVFKPKPDCAWAWSGPHGCSDQWKNEFLAALGIESKVLILD